MKNEKTTDKMRSESVGKLMLGMSVPMVISMVLQAFYNIVDSAFVSNMKENGELALNALTLAFPVQMLIVAISIGTGVGAGVLVSKSLGQGDKNQAGHAAGNAVFLAMIIYLLCLLFGVAGVGAYIKTQTKNPVVLKMAIEYLKICCVFSMGIAFFSIFEKLLQAAGLSVYSTAAQIIGAVINIIMDPILIYGLLGFPEMGVRGAAYATVVGQIVSCLAAFIFHIKYNGAIPKGIKFLKPSGKIIKKIYAIGFPAIIAQALMSVMTYSFNIILVRIDEAMVTAYGLYYKIQQFILFAAFGIRDAIMPIVSFNYGMRDKKRINEGIKYGLIYTLIITAAGMLLLEIFAKPFAAAFGLSGHTNELCISAMRIISLSFMFAGVNIALQGVFQALGGGMESLVVSLLRQCILVLPTARAFSLLAIKSMDYAYTVWLTFPIAEIICAAAACAFMIRLYRKKIKPI